MLEECPRELLLRAWAEIPALEASAVDLEVLVICRQRAEALGGLVAAETRLILLVSELLAAGRAPAALAAPSVADDRVNVLRDEIEDLRERIALLEGEPALPETESALAEQREFELARLREDLATAEAELDQIEAAAVAVGGTPADLPPPGPGGTDGEIVRAQAPVAVPAPAPEDQADGPMTAAAPPLPGAEDGQAEANTGEAVAPPGSDGAGSWFGELASGLTGGDEERSAAGPSEALPAGTAGPVWTAPPRERRSDWRVIHAVRGRDDAWKVRLQGTREIPFPVPGGIHWQPVLDEPVTLSEGESLGNGLTLLAVVPEGVCLDDPAWPDGLALMEVVPEGVCSGDASPADGEAVFVPFRTDESIAAGKADWTFRTVVEAGLAATLPEGLVALSVTEDGVLLADSASPSKAPVLVPFGARENEGNEEDDQ